jgi:hypothetical protein
MELAVIVPATYDLSEEWCTSIFGEGIDDRQGASYLRQRHAIADPDRQEDDLRPGNRRDNSTGHGPPTATSPGYRRKRKIPATIKSGAFWGTVDTEAHTGAIRSSCALT